MRGIDYAWQHPDPAAVAAAGYDFACRYFSRDPSKNITLTEAASLAAHDVWIVANWEYGAQDMLRGYNGGVADATLALAQATAAGMPEGRPIYFSADWDVTPAQEAAVTDYLRGAASVLGADQVGEYAGYYPVKVALDGGTARWTWQTTAWSGGQWDAREQIRQTGTAVIGGVSVDVNEALTQDFGQWQPGRLPQSTGGITTMTPQQEQDLLNQALNLYTGMFFGGSSMGTTPPGAADNSVVKKLDYLIEQAGKIDGLSEALAKLAVPSLDPAATAAALAAVPGFTDELAAAMVKQLLLAAGAAAAGKTS